VRARSTHGRQTVPVGGSESMIFPSRSFGSVHA
jgi:hypothetical protein